MTEVADPLTGRIASRFGEPSGDPPGTADASPLGPARASSAFLACPRQNLLTCFSVMSAAMQP
jgi:hypothetical protein